MKRSRYQKRQQVSLAQGSSFSCALRTARNVIAAGRHEEGLVQLNNLANRSNSDLEKASVILLVAESESILARHSDAAAAFKRAAVFARRASDMNLVLRAGLGTIRAYLGSSQYDEAKNAALALQSEFEKINETFDLLAAATPAQVISQGKLLVMPRPPRLTVALTKLANAFMERGYTDDAKSYLEKVIVLSPNGGSRARQCLAKLALASDDAALAERYARESLQVGRFQAKTISAWQLYIDARARQGSSPILEPVLLESLKQNSKGRIWAASVWNIIRSLRAHSDPAWNDLANFYLSRKEAGDPVITVEIEKILTAAIKLDPEGDPAWIANKSLELFRRPNSSPSELIAHGKDHVRFALLSNQIPQLEPLLQISRKRFGRSHTLKLRHSMAHGAIKAQSYEMAKSMFLELVGEQPAGSAGWGKAIWSLAVLESSLGQAKPAAEWYLKLAENTQVPERFRAQATLRAFAQLATLDEEDIDLDGIRASIRSIVSNSADFRLVFDVARQLNLGGDDFYDLLDEAAARGEILVDLALKKETTPRGTLAILEYLARRQYYDVRKSKLLLIRWEKLGSSEITEFEKCGGSIWYNYLSLVFLAMIDVGRKNDAVKLASEILNGNRESPEGYVILGSAYAGWLIATKEYQTAFTCFEWIVQECPKHRSAAAAHYWLGLRALVRGDESTATAFAVSARECFSGRPALISEWQTECKSYHLLRRIEVPAIPLAYEAKLLKAMKDALDYEILQIS
jgi:tetratricopeptide (TPR) repeat protein